MIVFSRAVMSRIASSQLDPLEVAGRCPLERVQHPVGIVVDLRERDPLRAGEALRDRVVTSGRSFVSRPSSTVATIPQSGSQIRQ